MASNRVIKNICVFGVGGVGGFFGGKLVDAFRKETPHIHHVFFVGRGPHLKEIQTNGLVLNTKSEGTLLCRPDIATDNVDDLPHVDLWLICVKAYDLKQAAQSIARVASDDTIMLPLLNGVDICERIRAVVDRGVVLPACVFIGTHIEKPGVVTQTGGEGIVLFGPDTQNPDFDVTPVMDIFEKGSIRHNWIDDPLPSIWEKYMFISAFGLVTAYSGKTFGEVFADRNLIGLAEEVLHEINEIARRKGIVLPNDVVQASIKKALSFPPDTKTSYQRDVETKGRKNEGDVFGGTIIRMGQNVGVPTPVTHRLYAQIQDRL